MYKEDLKKIFEKRTYFPKLGGEFYLGAMGFMYLLKSRLEKKVNQYGRK